MSPLHFLSYPRRKRDGSVVLWGAQEKFSQHCLGALGAREMRNRGSSGETPKSADNIACAGRSSTQIPIEIFLLPYFIITLIIFQVYIWTISIVHQEKKIVNATSFPAEL